jgi:His/Glu/Gln/Arg/opine family amino acid ABC transporter permease subunit
MTKTFSSLLTMVPQSLWILMPGLGLTVWLVAQASGLALGLALLVTLGRQLLPGWFNPMATIYCGVLRAVPLLIVLYFFYRGLPAIGILLPAPTCGILALALCTSAYLAEAFRTGLEALPKTQWAAGMALGLSPWQVFTRVTFPQALLLALPASTNLLIGQLKNSSLLAFITIEELFHGIYQGSVDWFKPVPFFIAGALLYGMLSLVVAGLCAIAGRLIAPKLTLTNGV